MGKRIAKLIDLLSSFGHAGAPAPSAPELPDYIVHAREAIATCGKTLLEDIELYESATPATLERALERWNRNDNKENYSQFRNNFFSLFRYRHDDPEIMEHAFAAIPRIVAMQIAHCPKGRTMRPNELINDYCLTAACLVPQGSEAEAGLAYGWSQACASRMAGIIANLNPKPKLEN